MEATMVYWGYEGIKEKWKLLQSVGSLTSYLVTARFLPALPGFTESRTYELQSKLLKGGCIGE